MNFAWRNPLLSPERVHRLERFAFDTVEHVVKFRARVTIAKQLNYLATNTSVVNVVAAIVAEGRILYPEYNIDVNLVDDTTEHRLSASEAEVLRIPTFVPEEDTLCRYVVGSGKVLEVLNSKKDLIVHNSPAAKVVSTYLGYPICVQGWPVGAMCVYGKEVRNSSYTSEDHKHLAEWAERVAVVLTTEAKALDTESNVL